MWRKRRIGLASAFGLVLAAVVCLGPAVFAGEEDLSVSTPRLDTRPDGSWHLAGNGAMTGQELEKMLETEIGAGNYEAMTVMLHTCYSGAGIDRLVAELSGVYNIITSSTGTQKTAYTSASGFALSFFDSVSTNPNDPVDSHFQKGVEGEPRSSTPSNVQKEKLKYQLYLKRMQQENSERQAEGKQPRAVMTEQQRLDKHLQDPQNRQEAAKWGLKKLAGGTESNHVIIFRTSSGAVREALAEKAKQAVRDAGVPEANIQEFTPLNDTDLKECQDAKEENRLPNFRDDLAMKSKLKEYLKTLKARMNNKEHLFFVLMAHGHRIELSANTQGAVGPGGGVRIDDFNNTDLVGEYVSGAWLAEEARYASGEAIADENFWRRWAQPALVIQTTEETNPSGVPVEVTFNGEILGDMTLDPAGLGFHYMEIPDEVITAVVDWTDTTSGFELGFNFADPADGFTLATKEDVEAMGGAFGYYGMSVVYNLEGAIPEPGVFLLVVIGLPALLALRCRRR